LSSKLRIRIGEVEIDYEGPEEFLKEDLPQLLKTAMELHEASGSPVSRNDDKKGGATGAGATGGGTLSLTTSSIAAKLGSKSGAELLTAAAAHLALVKRTEPFTRQQLLKEMKSATSYYSKNYSANLSGYIKTALQRGGPLSETTKNSYALTAGARADLEKKLADD